MMVMTMVVMMMFMILMMLLVIVILVVMIMLMGLAWRCNDFILRIPEGPDENKSQQKQKEGGGRIS